MTDHEAMVKEYVRLQEQKEHIDQQMDAIKTELRTLGAGSHPIAGVTVSVTPNRRIDNARVTSLYPFDSHPELYKLTPDSKLIRENLPPKVVDSLMHEVGEPRVAVK